MVQLERGTVVAGKLELIEPLGQGGMGSVWQARHRTLDTDVAVKFIRPERAADANLLRRFEREAKAAARITSPHVVEIKDYGLVDDSAPYIVMELLRGVSLTTIIDRDAPLSLGQVAGVVTQVAAALTSAHALGVVHRDIKPQNIFLCRPVGDGEPIVKVLDFGIAKVVGETQVSGATGITETGMVIGSPPYMSPEQLEGSRDVDHRADTWSLGIVAYQLLTGRLPFEGGSFVSVGAKVLRGRYEPATAIARGLPASVDDWLAKALSLDPADRFQSARALSDALVALATESLLPQPGSSASPDLAHATTVADTPAGGGTHTATAAAPAAKPDAHTDADGDEESSGGPAEAVPAETASSLALATRRRARAGPSRWLIGGLLALVLGIVAVELAPGWDDPAPAGPTVRGAADCPEGMTFVPGGRFVMGSAPGDEVPKNEIPQHEVEVAPFCLDTTEVTVAAYAACTGCGPPPKTVEGKEITSRAQAFWSEFCNANHAQREHHPINCVSWDQARTYCAARGRRLPSEAEWELAARGSDGRLFPWGNESPSAGRVNACGSECSELLSAKLRDLDDRGWPAMYDADDGAAATAPVGSFPAGASPLGLLDMAGNVWEWTASSYCYYDETDCRESRRVLRGGGWDVPDESAIRATRRYAGAPAGRGHNIGFRCAYP